MTRRSNGVRISSNFGQGQVDGSCVLEIPDHVAPRQSASALSDSAGSYICASSTSSMTSTEHIYVYLRGKMIEPSEDCARAIRKIFEERQDYEGFTWKKVSEETKTFYFLEFKKRVSWDDDIYTQEQVRIAWNKKASVRYTEMLKDIRSGGVKPNFMDQDVYERWLEYWDSYEAKKKSEQALKNRRSGSTSANAPAPPTHNAGSITHFKAAQKLAAKLGRKPFPREVYVITHTKKGDGMTFINEKSKKINDTIEANRMQLIQANEEINEEKLYFDSVGGMSKKNVVYGLGSLAYEYYRKDTSSSAALEVQQTIRELKRRLDEQDRLIAEMQRQLEIQQRKLNEDLQRQIDERIHAMIGVP